MTEAEPRPSPGYWRESWERLRANRVGLGAGVVILALGAAALAAPLLAAYVLRQDPFSQNLHATFAGPSGGHWLGTDNLGRDLLARLLYGSQVSLAVGFLSVALSTTVGAAAGIAAGYYGGRTDDVLMRVVDILLAIPGLYLLILITAVVTANAVTLACLIAFIGWGPLARLARAEVLSVRSRDYVLAARSIGARDARIVLRHVLPNVLHVLIVAASLGVGAVILLEAALDFIGLGVSPPTPTWGNMLSSAQSFFTRSAGLVVLPGAMIFVSVLATNLFGNALRDAFDPRLR
ncbi:MAG TPA: ABC transporter permease [Candidatus Dormibacteraeota bacterium]|jgi:peptide/nickel transport system permease protein